VITVFDQIRLPKTFETHSGQKLMRFWRDNFCQRKFLSTQYNAKSSNELNSNLTHLDIKIGALIVAKKTPHLREL